MQCETFLWENLLWTSDFELWKEQLAQFDASLYTKSTLWWNFLKNLGNRPLSDALKVMSTVSEDQNSQFVAYKFLQFSTDSPIGHFAQVGFYNLPNFKFYPKFTFTKKFYSKKKVLRPHFDPFDAIGNFEVLDQYGKWKNGLPSGFTQLWACLQYALG